jgi:hypothetical protein
MVPLPPMSTLFMPYPILQIVTFILTVAHVGRAMNPIYEIDEGVSSRLASMAEESIQLPPRDTEKSDKLHEKEGEDIHQGRELRKQQNG